jgi:hypothetical protein
VRAARLAALALAAALPLGPARADAGSRAPVCRTVDGAPAASSESLVLGLRDQLAAGSREGVQKFLDTGQTLFLHGGHAVEILERHPASGTVRVRRGAGQLDLWTLDAGVRCASPLDEKTE